METGFRGLVKQRKVALPRFDRQEMCECVSQANTHEPRPNHHQIQTIQRNIQTLDRRALDDLGQLEIRPTTGTAKNVVCSRRRLRSLTVTPDLQRVLSNAPTNAGSYTVMGTVVDNNYAGSGTNILTVTEVEF